MTTAARTLVDLARHNRRDGLMAADAGLRHHFVTNTELIAAVGDAGGWPGVRKARGVLALANPLAESPLESILRLAMHDDGFPAPALQVEIGGYRVDMALLNYRLIVEADGRSKYAADELWMEKQRENRLRAHGYRIERVLWADVMTRWPATSKRLWSALSTP